MSTINGKYIRFLIIGVLILTAALGLAYHLNQEKADQVLVEVKPITTSFGWGYEIISGGKVYIHQEFIPAIPGKHGFKNSEDALKVGKMVVNKLNAKQVPPTVTVEELRQLGIVGDSLVSK